MTLVMESDIKDYRLERWIALFLALLFLLPVVAQAEETPVALVRSTDIAPITIPLNGTDATLAWRCKSTGIDGFDQCALMLDRKVLTWRMAPEGQQLIARVTYGGEAVRYEVSRVAMR